jgi:hypothetical protein
MAAAFEPLSENFTQDPFAFLAANPKTAKIRQKLKLARPLLH